MSFHKLNPEWNLLGSLMDLVKVQSDSLTALKPTIRYIVKNNRCCNTAFSEISTFSLIHSFHRGFDYKVNKKGLLKSISPCQCLPKTEGTSLAVSGIQFACPTGKADPVSEEVMLPVIRN